MIDLVLPKNVRPVQIHSYTILGDPIKIARSVGENRTGTWNGDKEERVKFEISLSQQHDDLPLFSGPLLFWVTFFVAPPRLLRIAQRQQLINTWMASKPSSYAMLQVVQRIAQGILYTDEAHLVDVRSLKIYDDRPRTEIQIVPL